MSSASPCQIENSRPWPDAWIRGADPITPILRRAFGPRRHTLYRFLQVARRRIRQTCDYRTGCKYVRVGSEHDIGHSAPGRKARDEYLATVNGMLGHHPLNHLPNRTSFSLSSFGVSAAIPMEAGQCIVPPNLLGEEHRKAMTICQREPSRSPRVVFCRLSSTMQHDHERRLLSKICRDVSEHSKGPRIGPESLDLGEFLKADSPINSMICHLGDFPFPMAQENGARTQSFRGLPKKINKNKMH